MRQLVGRKEVSDLLQHPRQRLSLKIAPQPDAGFATELDGLLQFCFDLAEFNLQTGHNGRLGPSRRKGHLSRGAYS